MVRVFCDFDGTVALKDVGRELFTHFVGERAREIASMYIEGKVTARECLTGEAQAVGGLSEGECAEFVDQFGIDEHFRDFVEFCASRKIPLMILSDGLDFYVGRILHNAGLGGCEWFANHVEFKPAGSSPSMEVTFPFTDSECTYCGNCKRNHMITNSGDDDIIVYVGDGISDRCPVRFADVVFAKKELIRYCQEENISYFEFSDFGDVQRRLEDILGKKRIRKRREAEMARRDVFMQG